jgi:hypothetical protein
MSCLWNAVQKIGEAAYGLTFGPNPFHIEGSLNNLQRAIEEKGKDVIHYKFKDYFQTYSPLEFAVKINDKKSAATLINFGSKVEESSQGFRTVLHFYMDCLNEQTSPDLEMLDLLLDGISDVNLRDERTALTPLEHALKQMRCYAAPHWSVIGRLLQKGATIKEVCGTTPFMIVRDEHTHYREMVRSFEEEKLYLQNLETYLSLEKKYHPDSDSGLTFKEFLSQTSGIRNSISTFATCMDTTSFFSDVERGFLNELDNREGPIRISAEEQSDIDELKSIFSANNAKLKLTQTVNLLNLTRAFCVYHRLFQNLVKKGEAGTFKECFEEWQLNTLLPLLKNSNPNTPIVIEILKWF